MKLYRRFDNREFTPAARVRNTAKDESDEASDGKRSTAEYVSTCEYFHFQNFRFSVQDHTAPVVKELLSLRAGRDETYFGEESVTTSVSAGGPATTHENKCWYCWNKLTVTIVDMLTYPRPIRKVKRAVVVRKTYHFFFFDHPCRRLLFFPPPLSLSLSLSLSVSFCYLLHSLSLSLCIYITVLTKIALTQIACQFKLLIRKKDTLGAIRRMMVKEVGLRSPRELVLMTRGTRNVCMYVCMYACMGKKAVVRALGTRSLRCCLCSASVHLQARLCLPHKTIARLRNCFS